ncbi:hypothetical protein B0H14DRAFT_2581394 [Mycena olivaceomarginata]|nr:hypothetical protein B0H14DRAFT_2581394 [Mycena olivaceomarginata]
MAIKRRIPFLARVTAILAWCKTAAKKTTGRLPEAIQNSETKGGAFLMTSLVICRVARTASRIKCRILRPETKAFSWKGFRSLFKDIGERRTRFRSLSNEIGECIHCVKNIRTGVELILEAEHQHKLAGDPTETPSTLAVI